MAWKRHILPPGREGMWNSYRGYVWTDFATDVWTDFANTSTTWTKVN